MEIIELINEKKIPPVGIGPGGLGYTSHPKKKLLIVRVYNKILKIIFRKLHLNTLEEIKYINAVANALKIGFRIIDFSETYGDGSLIRKAIIKSKVPREELFITTRVGNIEQIKGNISESLKKQLKGLGVEYVDLLQFHWPVTDYYLRTWKEMEKLYDAGYCKSIGVANCNIHHLESIFKECKIKPAVNQFEVHPLFTQKPLIEYCKNHGIQVEAYSPLARMDDRLMRLPALHKIAEKHKKSIVQIILRWDIQNDLIPVVRSLKRKHQKELFNIFDFELTKDEMKLIDSININSRLRYDPDNCDFSIL